MTDVLQDMDVPLVLMKKRHSERQKKLSTLKMNLLRAKFLK